MHLAAPEQTAYPGRKSRHSKLTCGNNETGRRLLGEDGHPPELEVEQLTESLGQVQGAALGELQNTCSRYHQQGDSAHVSLQTLRPVCVHDSKR